MSQINRNQPEKNLELSSIIDSYCAKYNHHRCYPGLIFQQGKRTLLQINVPSNEIASLLQAKPPTGNDPDSGKDRPEIQGHSDKIKDYLIHRITNNKPWILGTLTANVAPELINVIELARGICLVTIPPNVKLDITDGQHRKIAIEDLTRNSSILNNDSFAITVILEGKHKQCQADFRDMAQAKPIEQSLLLSFGESIGVTGITNNIIETVTMFQGKTDKINKSPRKTTKLIYTSKFIATMVSFAFTDKSNDNLDRFDVGKSATALSNGLNLFFSNCRQTQYISQTNVEKLTLDEVKEFRRECLLGVSVGVQILGRLLYCTYNPISNQFDQAKVLRLAQLDWSRDNRLWHNNVVRVNPKSKKKDKTYISFGAAAVSDAVEMAKIELGWTQNLSS